MQLGVALSLPVNWLFGGSSGAASGAEKYLLDESNAPLLTEAGDELLLES